jgi:hypothetical protein
MDTSRKGRTASLLRILVLVLLAVMCYQLGYNAGFTTGAWERGYMWEAARPGAPDARLTDALE